MKYRILFIVANYYKDICVPMYNSAARELHSYKIKSTYIEVPGIFEIVRGISKTPGTLIIFTLEFFSNKLVALFNNPWDISL